jgi:hypothetical protein
MGDVVSRVVDGLRPEGRSPSGAAIRLGCLVAAKVDPEHPWRAAKIIDSHPGVSHNYLRDHDFNIWFTIATEPGSKLGLDGTLEVLQRLTGAESVRQLPTLWLFKIRMDLEMEEGTEALAAAAEAVDHQEPERSSCPSSTWR